MHIQAKQHRRHCVLVSSGASRRCWLLVFYMLTTLVCSLLSQKKALAQTKEFHGVQNYVGAERCGECHAFAYMIWATGPHAKAHLSLSPEQLKDNKCNNCHTLVEDSSRQFNGVQCERCHGPGKYYQPSYVMKDRELAQALGLVETQPSHCQQCHTEGSPSIEKFDFKTMWARIDHSKAAEQVWQRSQKSTKP